MFLVRVYGYSLATDFAFSCDHFVMRGLVVDIGEEVSKPLARRKITSNLNLIDLVFQIKVLYKFAIADLADRVSLTDTAIILRAIAFYWNNLPKIRAI